ncbi:hypothetical protein P4544_13220 [Halomonas sp. LY9]
MMLLGVACAGHTAAGCCPQPDVNLESLDAWAGLLLRQRLWVDNSRVMLHGQQQTVMLHAPSLLLNGDQRRTRLEGALNIVDAPDTAESELPAMSMRAEMQPGEQGFRDFSAALQLDMQLDHLVVLAALFRPDQMPFVEQVGGRCSYGDAGRRAHSPMPDWRSIFLS